MHSELASSYFCADGQTVFPNDLQMRTGSVRIAGMILSSDHLLSRRHVRTRFRLSALHRRRATARDCEGRKVFRGSRRGSFRSDLLVSPESSRITMGWFRRPRMRRFSGRRGGSISCANRQTVNSGAWPKTRGVTQLTRLSLLHLDLRTIVFSIHEKGVFLCFEYSLIRRVPEPFRSAFRNIFFLQNFLPKNRARNVFDLLARQKWNCSKFIISHLKP